MSASSSSSSASSSSASSSSASSSSSSASSSSASSSSSSASSSSASSSSSSASSSSSSASSSSASSSSASSRVFLSVFPNVSECIYTSCYCEENVWWLCHRVVFGDLSAELEMHGAECFAVFVSNHRKCVALRCQKSGDDEEDGLVFWDYHVFFVVRYKRPVPSESEKCRREKLHSYSNDAGAESTPDNVNPIRQASGECKETETDDPDADDTGTPKTYVYDMDTTLAWPCELSKYCSSVFQQGCWVSGVCDAPLFRVVPASEMVAKFASDRSHMLDDNSQYVKSPPLYKPIAAPAGVTMNLMQFVSMNANSLPHVQSRIMTLLEFTRRFS